MLEAYLNKYGTKGASYRAVLAFGFVASQYALGHSYLQTTEDQRKDLRQARFWLEKAAAQGNEEAAKDLAAMPAG